MDSVLFKEFSFSVVGGKVGSESELGGVGLIGGVVERLTGVVPGVATPGVVGIVVEGLTEVVLEVTPLEVVGIVVRELTRVVLEAGASEVVGADVVIDIDLRPKSFTQSPLEPLHEYPGSQHPSEHWVNPGSHGFRHLSVPDTHSVPLGQQKPKLSVHL